MEFTSEGQNAMKENGISMEDLSTFTEGDIQDLFQNFSDRRKARQIICSPKTKLVDQAIDHDSDSISDYNNDEASFSSQDLDQNTPKAKYGVAEMLKKKNLRGKSSPAQKYFSCLIRDAASAAKIWNDPKPINEIHGRKKDVFFNIINENVPELKSSRSEIMVRLKEHLQNRRKYLLDKSTGKRKSKKKNVKELAGDHMVQISGIQESDSENSVNTGTCTDTSVSSKESKASDHEMDNVKTAFNPGDVVYLKDKTDNMILGSGIIVSYEPVFSQIILKTKNENLSSELKQCELPDMEGCLGDIPPKSLITYFSKRLTKSKAVKRVDNTVGHSSDLSLEKGGTVIMEPRAHSKKRKCLDFSQTSPCSVKLSKRKKTHPSVNQNVNEEMETELQYSSFVFMEWGGGEVYAGLHKKTPTHEMVINASKPCLKFKSESEESWEYAEKIFENLSGTAGKINDNDCQLNANMKFCIFEEEITRGSPESECLCLISACNVKEIQVLPHMEKEFVKKMSEKLRSYLND